MVILALHGKPMRNWRVAAASWYCGVIVDVETIERSDEVTGGRDLVIALILLMT